MATDYHKDSAIARYEFDLERALIELRNLGFTRQDLVAKVNEACYEAEFNATLPANNG